jgi:hypothetical protein
MCSRSAEPGVRNRRAIALLAIAISTVAACGGGNMVECASGAPVAGLCTQHREAIAERMARGGGPVVVDPMRAARDAARDGGLLRPGLTPEPDGTVRVGPKIRAAK